MTAAESRSWFLDADELRPWKADLPGGLKSLGYRLGRGKDALEVAVATASSRPPADAVRKAFKRRHGNRAAPVLLVVLYERDGRQLAELCGPMGADPAVLDGLDPGQCERIARAALAEPDRHAAVRLLQATLPEVGQELPGLRNVGMFATHQLREGVPLRDDWASATEAGVMLLDRSGRDLVEALGFSVEDHGSRTFVLRREGMARGIAVFLDETESPDAGSDRFASASPVSHALAAADAEGLPYAVLTRGRQIRVHAAGRNIGVGRKGRTETFVEANLAVMPEDRAGYLPLIFGADALAPGGSFEDVLERSRDYAVDLGSRLRQRVYESVVPVLSQAIASRRTSRKTPGEEELEALYEQALVLLFRLLFLAYAEDKDLLPYRSSGTYQRNALKTLARELADRLNDEQVDDDWLQFDGNATDLWSRVRDLFRAVDRGNTDWGVPVYDGSLFSDDAVVSEAGAALADLELSNDELGPALQDLLVDRDEAGVWGPVDFRSLSVRDFGTIYEGLLESSLALAPSDLTLDHDDRYVPAGDGDDVCVEKDEIYLHDRSGGRKATGSYFTKPFAVEHLLDHALAPVLDEHVQRLQALVEGGDDPAARDAFFDFRCADIAMGSGHFLVAAVDQIEARLSSFLADHPIPGVVDELERLRATAIDAMGEPGAGIEIEQATLLRRQIARRCIYGVDRNRIAVELARVSLWIHTFVPGLPLSFLDHNLVWGDSLAGIGALAEASEALDPDQAEAGATLSIFGDHVRELLEAAVDALGRLAQTSDASAKEIAAAREAHADAQTAALPAKHLLDLACAMRLGRAEPLGDVTVETIGSHPDLPRAEELAADLQAVHFPVAFPEVFLRTRSGFDCIIGNPPWEEATIEELAFWAQRFPGLRGLPQRDQRRELRRLQKARPDLDQEFEREAERMQHLRDLLAAGPYEGMGTGDPDLYKAFCWRFWHLIRDGGAIGVVLPRSALSAAGSQPWREEVLAGGAFDDVTLLLNNRRWVFDEVHPQYSIALASIRKGPRYTGSVRMRGPYASRAALAAGAETPPAVFAAAELATWTSNAAFPLLPSARSAEVFLKLRAHPRFDSDDHPWRARPVRELDATNDKRHFMVDPKMTDKLWPVYKGASFYLWDNDTGEYYAWAEPSHITDVLQAKRENGHRNRRSAFSEMPATWISDPDTLPCRHPRVAFRDITNRTNQRTVVAALVPPNIAIANQAPYFIWPGGSAPDQAFVLAVLASIPLDWYARRLVETHVNFHVLNAFPIPVPGSDDPLRLRVIEIAGRLAATDDRFSDWADEVGVEVGSVGSDKERDELVYELDALVAHLYGLDSDDVTHVFETFHEGWDYAARLERVLEHHERLAGDR